MFCESGATTTSAPTTLTSPGITSFCKVVPSCLGRAITLATLLSMHDLALEDTAADHARFIFDAGLRDRCLDRRRRRHHRIETLLHAFGELRMAHDEEVVVHDAVHHALARFQRVHRVAEAARTGRARRV